MSSPLNPPPPLGDPNEPELTPPPQSPVPETSNLSPDVDPDYKAPWERKAEIAEESHEAAAIRAERRAKKARAGRFRIWRKYLIWGGLIYFVWWFYHPHGIFVFADPLSAYRYREVLQDLRQEMPEEYQLVRDHIDQIKISYIITGGNYAGYAQEGDRGDKKVTLLENTFIQGPGYAHSTLVHEACHGLQFEQGLPFTPFCQNQAREHACNQWGLKVLRHFDADADMIEHYERIAEGHTVYGNSCLREGKLDKMPEL